MTPDELERHFWLEGRTGVVGHFEAALEGCGLSDAKEELAEAKAELEKSDKLCVEQEKELEAQATRIEELEEERIGLREGRADLQFECDSAQATNKVLAKRIAELEAILELV